MKNLFVVNTPYHLMTCFILTHSIYENDEYQIAISAKGDPKKSKTLKEKISKLFND